MGRLPHCCPLPLPCCQPAPVPWPRQLPCFLPPLPFLPPPEPLGAALVATEEGRHPGEVQVEPEAATMADAAVVFSSLARRSSLRESISRALEKEGSTVELAMSSAVAV